MAEVKSASTNGLESTKAFYTIPDLVSRWGVCRATIYNEIRRGRLKRKHIAGTVRFAAQDIADYERKAG